MAEKKSVKTTEAVSDKQRAISTAMDQIEKMYGKGSIMRFGDKTDMSVDFIPTGSLALDLALGIGGLPRGRIVEIYGPESSGKTTLALHVVAEAQKRGGEAWLVLEELSECLSDNSGEDLGESFALREALNSFLASLDEKTRVIFMQRYFYTCSVREIAAARGLKESAVTMLLFRTRQKLKEHLHKEGFDL